MKKTVLHLIQLQGASVFTQLQLEEALLRADDRNFCIINTGSPRAIVMGISGHPNTLLDLEKVKRDQIPVIRRFSGGGTVIIDEETLLISFIFAKDAIDISAFPEPILRWSADVYARAWNIAGFSLRENDYVIEDRKCGGNAQYLQKDRWLHHTSFLWNYRKENMQYLLLPAKRPKYRLDRSHEHFLCSLQEHRKTVCDLIEDIEKELVKRFYIQKTSVEELLLKDHRKTVQFLSV